jgi:hypothetical protein
MSIELISKTDIKFKRVKIYFPIVPQDIREPQRTTRDVIRKHYGHEFLPK